MIMHIPIQVTNRIPGFPKYSFSRSVMMNVIGKAITPAVITTSLNSTPKMVMVNGREKAVKNLAAVASATTRAVRKMAVQTTNSFWGRVS